MELSFDGMTILVTGATRGIGAAIADAFVEHGGSVILTGTQPDEVKRLNEESGERLRYWTLDLNDNESTMAFLEKIGGLDALHVCVNCAGINRIHRLEDFPVKEIDQILNVNLRGPLLVCKAVTPVMKQTGFGRIVNIGSIWSVISKQGRSVYAASKCGIAGMSKTLALELAKDNILVNCLSPGFINTELTASTMPAEEQKRLAGLVPLGRFGRPEEIARVVLFLASEWNTYLTGQNIVVDGGYVSV